jgi:uncharacterized protein
LSRDLLLLFSSFVQAPALARLLIFFLVWLVVWMPIAIVLAVVLKWNPLQPSTTAARKIPLIVSLYVVAPIAIWGVSGFEQASWATYGLVRQTTLQAFGLGAGTGTIGLLGMFFLQQQLGWLKLGRSTPTASLVAELEATGAEEATEIGETKIRETKIRETKQSMILSLLLIVALGLWVSTIEELVFRGFLWNQLQQDYAPWLAATIVSLLFAVLHLVWEGGKILPQLPGLWLMGMVLSLARWADQGQLGLAIGLHAGWIWTLASFDRWNLLHYPDHTAKWITGFDDHPLAGAMGLGFLLLTGAGLLGATYR